MEYLQVIATNSDGRNGEVRAVCLKNRIQTASTGATEGVLFVSELVLKLKVLTPMFLAGADGKTAELRPPAVKGLLRFWWRATQAGNPELAINEGKIFGAGGDRGSKSGFSLEIRALNLEQYRSRKPLPRHEYEITKKGRTVRANILEYLAYGTSGREYLSPGFRFELVLRVWEEANLEELLKALQVFCLFGNLGARSRNGFGSFKVEEARGHPDLEVFESIVPGREVMQKLCTYENTPPYSAFAKGARLFKTKQKHNSWDGCLAELAHAYREARLSLEQRHHYEKRQYVGAPIIVNRDQVSLLSRRAKPYFLRVHEENGKHTGYLLYLPSRYLPPRYCPELRVEQETYSNLCMEDEDRRFTAVCQKLNERLAKRLEVIF